MRTKSNWMSKFVASLAVCGFLLGVGAASAASKPEGTAGPIQDQGKDAFLASLANDFTNDDGYCESTCCYAWFADCSGGSTSCSNEGCSWSCDGVGGGFYSCSAQ
jgi:hypothetical protein